MGGREEAITPEARIANLVMGAVLTAVGIAWCVAASQVTSRMAQGFGNAGFLPFWAGALLAITSLGMFIVYWRTRTEPAKEGDVPLFDPRGQVRVAGMLLVLLTYIIFLERIHYAISTFVLVLIGLALAGEPLRPRLLVFAVLITAFLYGVFIKILRVPLPGSLYF